MLLACVLLYLFLAVASADGFYFHLWKYRLHARPESAREHLLHTINSCLFVPQVFLLFCARAQGAWLVVAVASVVATLAVELLDVFEERPSRRALGGLTSTEYASHFLMSGLRMGAVCALLGSRSMDDLSAPAALAGVPWWVAVVGWSTLIPGVLVALLHVVLVFTGRRAIAAASLHGAAQVAA
jgi:hypothetical protein